MEHQYIADRILATLKGITVDITIIELHFENRIECDVNQQLRNVEMEDIRQAIVLRKSAYAGAARSSETSRSTLSTVKIIG